MVRPKSGPGAKRAVWHTLFGKQRNGSSQVEARRLGSSRANVVARKQVWLQLNPHLAMTKRAGSRLAYERYNGHRDISRMPLRCVLAENEKQITVFT
jgi:hypothetical protein